MNKLTRSQKRAQLRKRRLAYQGTPWDSTNYKRTESGRMWNQVMDTDVSSNYRVHGRQEINSFDEPYIPVGSVSSDFDVLSPMIKSSFSNVKSTPTEGNYGFSRITSDKPESSLNVEFRLSAVAQGPQVSTNYCSPSDEYLPLWNVPKKFMDSQNSTVHCKDQQISLKVIVVPVDYPGCRFTVEQAELVQAALFQCFETLENGFYPQFQNSYVEFGTYVLTCANSETKNWLERIVPYLKPWEGSKLCLRDANEAVFNRMRNKVLFKVPMIFSNIDISSIVDMLGMQNYPLWTKNWRIINCNSNISGRIVVVLIDDPSLQTLKKSGMNAFLGLGKIRLTILKESGEKHVD